MVTIESLITVSNPSVYFDFTFSFYFQLFCDIQMCINNALNH